MAFPALHGIYYASSMNANKPAVAWSDRAAKLEPLPGHPGLAMVACAIRDRERYGAHPGTGSSGSTATPARAGVTPSLVEQ